MKKVYGNTKSWKQYFVERTVVNPQTGCHEWTGCITAGRPLIKHEYSPQNGTRLAWKKLVGLIPDGLHVLHHCDNGLCLNIAHLYLGTHQDNMRDKAARGRSSKGNLKGSVLTSGLVREIRRERRELKTLAYLAEKYGVTVHTIGNVCSRRTWKEVSTE